MNEKDKLSREIANRRLFKLGTPLNAVRFNSGNTDLHEMAKAKICLVLVKEGHNFLTEAEFQGGRADIVDLTRGIILEVLHSEKEENLQKKRLKYPLLTYGVHSDVVLFDLTYERLEKILEIMI